MRPPHHKGDGSRYTQHDQAYHDHHALDTDVTEETGDDVAATLKKNGLTLYAVVPPPFIAPEYQQIVDATHGKSYNIITEEGRISRRWSARLGIRSRPSTRLLIALRVRSKMGPIVPLSCRSNYGGNSGGASTSYQVRGVGGAAINVPEDSGTGSGANTTGTGLQQLSFKWWNGAVPLIALAMLFALSKLRFGVSTDELKAALEAQARTPAPALLARRSSCRLAARARPPDRHRRRLAWQLRPAVPRV